MAAQRQVVDGAAAKVETALMGRLSLLGFFYTSPPPITVPTEELNGIFSSLQNPSLISPFKAF